MDPIAKLNKALEGRYRVERRLGEGGMATVYLAHDLRHHRHVALKALKPAIATEIGAERFLAEIKTTANLHHPHILPLHDSGEAHGLLFYTMPYVDGETLEQRLAREGALAEQEAARIASDVADALHVAHARGVVHRDIKPSNILLSHGKAVVADFGIARAVDAAGTMDATELMTRPGVVLGTPAYMSPEQAAGGPGLDHRTDVYSLGCVLFEMLTGRRPYTGSDLREILAKQLQAPVPSVRALRAELSPAIDSIVAKTLAKSPAERFESAGALAAALASGVSQAAAPAACTVFVLPFVNRSPDPEDDYFSDGLTDEVISDLASVSALRVVSRNSAMALKGTVKDTPTLARELNATHVVTGTVRRMGDALRITAELVDAGSDTTIWSKKFSGSMDDVFGFQEEISRHIVAALEVNLTSKESENVARHPIDNPVAYDCYLRACQLMYDWTPSAQQRAVRLVDEAITLVGAVPLLLAMKGQLYWNQVNMSLAPKESSLADATRLADEALAHDPDCHLATFVRGLVKCTSGRPEEGLVDVRAAHLARPGDSNILLEMLRFSLASGLRDCRPHVERLAEIDPLTPQSVLMPAIDYGLNGPRERAAEPGRRAIARAPETLVLHVSASWWIATAGARDEAAGILDGVARKAGDGPLGVLARLMQCALVGDRTTASRLDTSEMEQVISNEYLTRMIADSYALLGRKDDALRALRTTVRLGFLNYPNLTIHDEFLESLWNEPEFEALMAEVEPRWQALVDWEAAQA